MQIIIDTRDSEEDIRKAIAILQKLLEEKRESSALTFGEEAKEEPKIEIIDEMPKKEKKEENKKRIMAELFEEKKEERKKDEAFDVGELVPY